MQIVSFDFIYSPTILVIFVSTIIMIAFIFLIFEFIKNGNDLLLFLFSIMSFFLFVFTCFFLKNPQNKLVIEYINENINNEINMSKEQIINDILSGKITQNKNNLPVYSQEIPITKEEYERLSKYKEEYNQKIENGNVNIIN